MSDAYHRTDCLWTESSMDPRVQLAGEALAEARAILAETEDSALPCEARNLPGIFRADVARLVRAFVEGN